MNLRRHIAAVFNVSINSHLHESLILCNVFLRRFEDTCIRKGTIPEYEQSASPLAKVVYLLVRHAISPLPLFQYLGEGGEDLVRVLHDLLMVLPSLGMD